LKALREAIRRSDFIITAELSLTPDSTVASIVEQTAILRPHVDAIQVTENQYGKLHLSPLAAASILIKEGVDPVMQLSTCNRNRAALIGDLLGARAIGVTSLLLVRGKKLPDSYQPQPQQVLDVGVEELIATAKVIGNDERTAGEPEFLIGAAVTAHTPTAEWAAPKIVAKVDAGAKFIQTQLRLDLDVLRRFVAHLVSLKLTWRCSVIADIAVLPSAQAAKWLRHNLSHIMISAKTIRRLEQASDPEREGIAICSMFLQEMATIPGLSGANLIATGNPEAVVAAIKASGLRGG